MNHLVAAAAAKPNDRASVVENIEVFREDVEHTGVLGVTLNR